MKRLDAAEARAAGLLALGELALALDRDDREGRYPVLSLTLSRPEFLRFLHARFPGLSHRCRRYPPVSAAFRRLRLS